MLPGIKYQLEIQQRSNETWPEKMAQCKIRRFMVQVIRLKLNIRCSENYSKFDCMKELYGETKG